MENYHTYHEGEFGTSEYRVYFLHNNRPVSPFHDIPTWASKKNKVVNMVVEIPRETQHKLEISTNNFMNPIKHDIKKGKIRIVAYPYPANYGAIPQTWENPNIVNELTGAKGDNDPIDIFDISMNSGKIGQIKQVKILTAFAMVDEGETDWKVIGIDINDPLADKLENSDSIEKVMPNLLNKIFMFLRDYKIPDGKPQNRFAFNGKPISKELTSEIINDGHMEWKKLFNHENNSSGMALIKTV